MVSTKDLIMLATGIIFVALATTGMQYFFVEMTSNYNISTTDGGVDFSLLNSSSYGGLQNSTTTLEQELNKSSNPDGTGFLNTNFFDTAWNSIKTAVGSMYYSLGITKDMVQGAGQGIGASTGINGNWIAGGLIAIISITIVLMLIGWWMNR